MVRFGPAGNAENFYLAGNKHSFQMPEYLEKIGLEAYEYQCGRGVNISDEQAKKIAEEAKKHGVVMSLHAPYFISLSSVEKEKRDKSIEYVEQSVIAADNMGASRVVIHSGSCAKMSRRDAMELAKDTLKRALAAVNSLGLSHIHLCPETMGKINQLGDLDEVLELCSLDESLIPTIDFGHLNARTLGGLKEAADFERIFDAIENKLGFNRLKYFHSHFSKIEYTAGGEKRHLTFEDDKFGPDFIHVAKLVKKKALCPTFICESSGTMDVDALKMKSIYSDLKLEGK